MELVFSYVDIFHGGYPFLSLPFGDNGEGNRANFKQLTYHQPYVQLDLGNIISDRLYRRRGYGYIFHFGQGF